MRDAFARPRVKDDRAGYEALQDSAMEVSHG
jgi:hypothetical protein